MERRAGLQMLTMLLLGASALPAAAPVQAAPVKTKTEACSAVKVRVAADRHFPVSAVAFCDTISLSDSPPGYYVLALHSRRQCAGICSTNMGWFAIDEKTGRVFNFDVGEWKVGSPVGG
jgi:hypothetical protein